MEVAMPANDPRVEELLAKEEIHDVLKRLARGTDRLDAEMMASCYHPDGFDDHNAFRGSGTEFSAWVLEALAGFAATMHFIASPAIRIEGEVAQVDTYCVAHHVSKPDEAQRQTDIILGLRYVDRFERRAGRWLIAKRVCSFDWTYTVEVDAGRSFPFLEDFTVGRRDRSDITYSGL
jgi:hypothetical protein